MGRNYSVIGTITPGDYDWLANSTLVVLVGVGAPLPITLDAVLTYNDLAYGSAGGFFSASGINLHVDVEPRGVTWWPQSTQSSLSAQWVAWWDAGIPQWYHPWPIAIQSKIVSAGVGAEVTADFHLGSAYIYKCDEAWYWDQWVRYWDETKYMYTDYQWACDPFAPEPPLRVAGSLVPINVQWLEPATLSMLLEVDDGLLEANDTYVLHASASYGTTSITANATVVDGDENRSVAIRVVPSNFGLNRLCGPELTCSLGTVTVNAVAPKTCDTRQVPQMSYTWDGSKYVTTVSRTTWVTYMTECSGRLVAPSFGVGAAGLALALSTAGLANVRADGVAVTSPKDARLLFASAAVFSAIVDHVIAPVYWYDARRFGPIVTIGNPAIYWYDTSVSMQVGSELQTMRTSTFHEKTGPTHSVAAVSQDGPRLQAGIAVMRVDSQGARNMSTVDGLKLLVHPTSRRLFHSSLWTFPAPLFSVSEYIEVVGATLLQAGPFMVAVAQLQEPLPPAPPSPAPTSTSPPTPSSNATASTTPKLRIELTASGTVSDVSEEDKVAIATAIADLLGVPMTAVVVTIMPASVLIVIEITFASATERDAGKGELERVAGSAANATVLLASAGVTITETPIFTSVDEPIDVVAAGAGGSGVAIAVGVAAGVLLVLGGGLFVLWWTKRAGGTAGGKDTGTQMAVV